MAAAPDRRAMFDRQALSQALCNGPVARVVVAEVHGSTPREVGAAMLVWHRGQDGTIGGGALEWEAVAAARRMLAGIAHAAAPEATGEGAPLAMQTSRIPLGPALGQCCGGAVTLWTEVWAHVPEGPVIARGPGAMPLAVARTLDRARARGETPATALVQGWLVEAAAAPTRHLWVWGAGHVGRAVVGVIAPLPGVAVTWVDVARDRFPDLIPPRVTVLTDPGAIPPPQAEHLVMTFSHALDLEICHRLLGQGFRSLGLIGSATKAARFRSRLAALGHPPAGIARLQCPIGDPALGKHPQAIAIGVAVDWLRPARTMDRQAFG